MYSDSCSPLCPRQPTACTPCNPVVPQGEKTNSRGKKMPHGTRLYSIAASRYGDTFDGKTTSLCVRRATFWDSEKNEEDPEKKGICSNFLCDAKAGDEIKMTGLCCSIHYQQGQHTESSS